MALRGALAASVTPLRDQGTVVDDDAFGPLCDFFVETGLDGVLALGTAGEGILLRVDERRHVADCFLQAADNRLQVAVHCGAQTTADTVTLAAHAAGSGRMPSSYRPSHFKLDEKAQYAHFFAAASACAPRFYVYSSRRPPDMRSRPRCSSACADGSRTSSDSRSRTRRSTRSRSTSFPASTSSSGRSVDR
jgi:dihydrodipicolinate synthase/N-acetylneuraminate lyase